MSRPTEPADTAPDPGAAAGPPAPPAGAARGRPSKGSKAGKNTATGKGKGKGKGKGGAAPEPGALPSVAGHPHARASVSQIKAGVALGAFAVALLLSLRASVPLDMAAERALIAGVCGYVVAWACALAVWRALLAAELRARVDALQAARENSGPPAR
jgi:hypothetical protein